MTESTELAQQGTSVNRPIRTIVFYLYFLIGLGALILAPLVGWVFLAVAAIAAITGIGVTRRERIALAIYVAIGIVVISLIALLLFPGGTRAGDVDSVIVGMSY